MINKRLKDQVDNETWIECLETLIGIGFSLKDEEGFKNSITKTLKEIRINAR